MDRSFEKDGVVGKCFGFCGITSQSLYDFSPFGPVYLEFRILFSFKSFYSFSLFSLTKTCYRLNPLKITRGTFLTSSRFYPNEQYLGSRDLKSPETFSTNFNFLF